MTENIRTRKNSKVLILGVYEKGIGKGRGEMENSKQYKVALSDL